MSLPRAAAINRMGIRKKGEYTDRTVNFISKPVRADCNVGSRNFARSCERMHFLNSLGSQRTESCGEPYQPLRQVFPNLDRQPKNLKRRRMSMRTHVAVSRHGLTLVEVCVVMLMIAIVAG